MHHLDKFHVLAGIANRFSPTLEEDLKELDQEGHSSATRSREFAALAEVLACELYTTLDGIRRAIFGAFHNVRGVQNESTKRLFQRATDKKYGAEFPEELRIALDKANVDWFQALRRLRTELMHGSTGSCHLSRQTGMISYLHNRLGTATSTLVETDIVGRINDYVTKVPQLVETLFTYLYARLEPREHRTMCGMYMGGVYERTVVAGERLTWEGGICASREWFESQPGLECPLQRHCPAHSRSIAKA